MPIAFNNVRHKNHARMLAVVLFLSAGTLGILTFCKKTFENP